MLPNQHDKLAEELRQGLRLNKARADCFASAAMAAVQAQSVRLADIAVHLPGEARADSKFRRLQNFFLRLRPDYELVARFILGLLGAILGQKPLVIAMDRTSWEARDNDVNLLVLSICLGDAGQPLLWTDLRHPGNSNTKKRIRLTRRLLRILDVPRIQCLVGDREFVGEDWFAWLLERRIPFVMRLRENMKTTPKDGRTRDARAYFAALRPGEWLGRRAQSIFRRGRELLASMFLGTCRHLRQTVEKAFGLLRGAQTAPS